MAGPALAQDFGQEGAGDGGGIDGQLLWRAGGDDASSATAAGGSHVKQIIYGFEHVQVVLDDDDGVAGVHQALQHGQQHFDVFKVQAGGGLVQDVERLAGGRAGEFRSQFHALALAAAQSHGALAQADVAQAHVQQRAQLGGDAPSTIRDSVVPIWKWNALPSMA